MADRLTAQSKDFSKWYTEVVQLAELADYSSVKGSMIIRPYGYAIWERIQAELDAKIKEMGVPNAYFPLFIPESYLHKEAKHVEGFSPELVVATIAGGQELEEKLIVRPTSETIINESFGKWIKSYRDLPMKVNQWANVVRWELRTRLFLRTSEFLWQEGHTCHATKEEAIDQVHKALSAYRSVFYDLLALPVVIGMKSESEKFAGADTSMTCELLTREGKALQSATSHYLGQNFAKAFDVGYLDKDGKRKHVHQTSWGLSTRVIGGLVMTHCDDKGLILPPNVAPVQVVILPIYKNDSEKKKVMSAVAKIAKDLEKFRVYVDERDEHTLGYKSTEWEIKGVPLRIEIGPKDLEKSSVMGVHRIDSKKEPVKLADLKKHVETKLPEFQKRLLKQAEDYRDQNTKSAKNAEEAIKLLKSSHGFVKISGVPDELIEEKIKKEASATSRVIVEESGETFSYFAKAY